MRHGISVKAVVGTQRVDVARLLECLRLAKRDQPQAPPAYQPSGEWPYLLPQHTQETADRLANMFRTEVTDIGASFSVRGIGSLSPRGLIKSRLIAQRMQQDLRVWRLTCGGNIEQLAAPPIGNPWGVMVDGHLLYPGVCRADYFAYTVANLLDSQGLSTVVEIGGGYGEFAYRLLKRRPQTKYLCFDLPEVLLKSSYFLMSAFPDRKFRLYDNRGDDFDIALLPNFLIPEITASDLTINTRSLSEMGANTVTEYVAQICRFTSRYFLHENSNEAVPTFGDHREVPANAFPITKDFGRLYVHKSPWSDGGGVSGRYVEYLYERHDALYQREVEVSQ